LNTKQPKLVDGESKCPEGTFYCDEEVSEVSTFSAGICVDDDLKAKAEKSP